ncbi:hypothetical protein ACHAPJ_001392 [Fusarium lateritium]
MDFRGRSWSRGAEEKSKPTTRMNDETWEKFKPFLCNLYKNYTLNIVMNIMEKRFGIVQSKRQYGYRFEKWGIRKYNANEKKIPPNALTVIGNHESTDYGDVVADFDGDPRSFNSKSLLGLPDEDTLMTTAGSDDTDCDDMSDVQGSSSLLIQFPWGTGSDDEANQLAADFCAAMLDDTNAFALYSNLYASLSNTGQSSPETRRFMAIACARVAGEPDNARNARELLSEEWPQTSSNGNSEDPFVLSMLKAYVGSHHEDVDNSSSSDQIRHNIEQVLDNERSLIHIPHKYSSIDLVAFFFLNYGLEIYNEGFDKSNPPDFMIEHVLNEFIKRQPFMKASHYGVPSPLRRCIEWCEEQLRLNHPVALQDAPVQPSSDTRCWWHNIRVFCTLWRVMTNLVRSNCAPEWYTQCESAFGISPSELLVTLTWMIRAETTSADDDISDAKLLQHAADGAKHLLELDEPKLWIDFLNRFAWMNYLTNPGEDQQSFEAQVKDQLRKFVSEMLRVQLPHQPENQPTGVADMDFYGFTQHGFGDFDMNPQMGFYR